jgi:hypothetical protein
MGRSRSLLAELEEERGAAAAAAAAAAGGGTGGGGGGVGEAGGAASGPELARLARLLSRSAHHEAGRRSLDRNRQ